MFISPVQTSPQSSIDTLPRLAPAPVCEQADLVIDELDGLELVFERALPLEPSH